MSGLRWKQPETMIASVGPPVMKPITLLVSQIQGFKGRSCLVNWALSWFPYKWCLLHSIYPLPWPWKCSSGSYCGLFLFLISSTQPASSPPPAENESLVVLSPTQQLRPPTRGCPASLRGSSAQAQFNITVLPNEKRCLDHPLEHAHYPSLSSRYKMFMRTMHIESWDLPYLGKMKRTKPHLWGMRTVGHPNLHWGWDELL